MTRSEKHQRIVELRGQGFTNRQIGAILGLSRSTISDILNDPDRSKALARRRRYAGTCRVCGKPTDGSNGPSSAPRYCLKHANEAHALFGRDGIIERIQTWTAEHGHPPSARDWNPHMARQDDRPDIAERFERDACWPYSSSVTQHFGSWNNGIRAAGYQPLKAGSSWSDSYQIRCA